MLSKTSTEPIAPATHRISRRMLLLSLGTVAIAGGGVGGGLALWNYLHERSAVYTYRGSHDAIYAVAWSPNGQRLAASSEAEDGTSIWDALTGEHLLSLGDSMHPSKAKGLTWSPDSKRLASASFGDSFVWDAQSGQPLAVYPQPEEDADETVIAWSPDGTRLVSGGDGYAHDPTAQIWEAVSGKTLLSLRDLTPDTAAGYLYSLAWSPNGRWIATAGFGYAHESLHDSSLPTLQVWDAATGALVFTQRGTGRDQAILAVSWSPDSKYVVTGDTTSQAQIWDIASNRLLLTYHDHNSYVNAVGWSPDGKWIASAGSDTTAQVWDPQTGQTIYTYRGHSKIIRALAWSPDGTYVATGSEDTTIQIWRAH